jgi:hypothetical protein
VASFFRARPQPATSHPLFSHLIYGDVIDPWMKVTKVSVQERNGGA